MSFASQIFMNCNFLIFFFAGRAIITKIKNIFFKTQCFCAINPTSSKPRLTNFLVSRYKVKPSSECYPNN